MNTMKLMLCAAAMMGSAMVLGQATAGDPAALAKARAATLTTELGLNEKQAAAMEETLLAAEKQVAPERAKCAEIQSTIDATMNKSYASLNGVLTPEQLKKLKSMPAGSCTSHAGCNHEAKASAGCAKDGAKAGCCAGKAGATGAAAPARTAEPMKTTIN